MDASLPPGLFTGPDFTSTEVLTEAASQLARLGGWELVVDTGDVFWCAEVAKAHGMAGVCRLTAREALAPYLPESRQRFEAHLEACARHGTPFDGEFELVTGAGRHVHFRAIGRAVHDGSGRVIAVVGACQDVTELRLAQQRAVWLGEQLEATLERMSDAFVVLDAQARVVHMNGVAERLLGQRRQDAVGRALARAFPRLAGTRHEAETLRALQRRVAVTYEEFSPPPIERWLEVRAYPLADGGLTVFVRDITERKLAQAEQHAADVRLWQAQKLESLGTLAGGIAHDFNNMLGAMLGHAGLALEVPCDEPTREHLEQIRAAGERARALVRRILTFSRRDVGGTPRVVQPLAPVLHEALELMRAILPAGVELRIVLPPAEVLAEVDATSIQQVVMNLCTNAWQALIDGRGWIEVGLERATLDAEQAGRLAGTLQPGDHVHLWVGDNGTGIDEATRARLFEPFFTTKPRGQGTGLGLPVVHGIVSTHGGAIDVRSAPGAGAWFHVWLPASRAPRPGSDAFHAAAATPAAPPGAPPAAAPRPAAAQAAGRRHVLLVDDDPVVLLTSQQILRRLGHDVTAHVDARAAMTALRESPQAFDLVVTDFSMPAVSGLDVAREVHALRPGLPVVVASGYLGDDVRALADGAGVAALVHKEALYDSLGDVVARVLDGAALSAATTAAKTPMRG